MAFAKRIVLFLAVNFAIMMMLSLVMNLLGVRPYLDAQGINYESLMVFCLIWGMGGSFISLMLSKTLAKWMMGVQIVDPNTRSGDLQELVQTVHNLARGAGLSKMPEVGIYQSPELNAFATGPSRSNSLVAVSTGLLQRMKQNELEGVLGHEVAHIANGDMVTMTLIQGVVNAFVMFLARIVAFVVTNLGRGRDDEGGGVSYFAYHMTVIVFDMIFGLFGAMIVAWFSRYREYRADAGGARIAGRDRMIAALEKLKSSLNIEDPHTKEQKAFQSLKISTRPAGILALLSTHPPLETRIARLETMTSV